MKRFLKVICSIAVIAALGWTACANAKSEPVTPHSTYTVKGGDTLWGIIESNDRYIGKDTREVIYEIEQLNHMDSSTIQPGQVLQLP